MFTELPNERSKDIDNLSIQDMLYLINEEEQTVAPAVKEVIPKIAEAVELVINSLRSGGRVIYMGAGTSGRLGMLDASECPPTFNAPQEWFTALIAGGEKALFQALEGVEDFDHKAGVDLEAIGLTQKNTLIGISASGSTPYVLAGLKFAGRSIYSKYQQQSRFGSKQI